jgi:hypothetical protein
VRLGRPGVFRDARCRFNRTLKCPTSWQRRRKQRANDVGHLSSAIAAKPRLSRDFRSARRICTGSAPIARVIATNSTTSSRRSPRSYLATKDWGFLRRRATFCCVRPAVFRALTRSAQNTPCAGHVTLRDSITDQHGQGFRHTQAHVFDHLVRACQN